MKKTLSWFLVVVLLLSLSGLAVLASASGVNGLRLYRNEYHFVTRQLIWLGVAMVLFCAAAFFDYHKWRQYPALTIVFYLVILALMVLVLFGPVVKGSRRWLSFGPFRMQPSEFAKLLAVIATAVFLDRIRWRIEKFWRGALPAVLIVGVLMGLAVLEPDFGATMVIALAGGMMFLVSGMKFVHMGIMAVMGMVAVGIPLVFNKNRMHRIAGWLPDWMSSWFGIDPALETDVKDVNHQLNMALVSIRHGGVTGVGFTESMQKQQYLPEAHTDFIFAIGAEELGLLFSLFILFLFFAFFVCGIRIALRAPDNLGRLLAYGMTFVIFFQALFNIGVVTGCLPTKGIALPFISYGGTNLMTAMIAAGVIFSVGRQIELPKPRPRCTIFPISPEDGVQPKELQNVSCV